MYGILNSDTNEYKKGLKVHVLNEYHDKTSVGEYVYVVRVIDDDQSKYINTHESKYISNQLNFESKHGSIEVFSKFRITIN